MNEGRSFMEKKIHQLQVSYMRGREKILVGELVCGGRRISFEYSPDFLKTGLQLSPFKLPLKAGPMWCEDTLFDGLFGVFNDSLPDGWGRLLLDRKLTQLGINLAQITPLDRLSYVGGCGMGALSYFPEIKPPACVMHEDLDHIAKECLQFQCNEDDFFVDDLLRMNGSSAGARPKILVTLVKEKFQATDPNPEKFHNDWIIKFGSIVDPTDIGPIEYAYHQMALSAGMDVPEAKLFFSKKDRGYFGVKRFDRVESGYLHMHSLSGLLHVDYRIPSLDYETLVKITQELTKSQEEVEKQFRHAIFNVLSHNRDDHGRNFSFLMCETGTWHVSPAYDLTFSSGPAGEHCTTLMGEGKNIKSSHFLALAKVGGIQEERAKEIIEEVKAAMEKWPSFAEEAKVTKSSTAMIHKALLQLIKAP